MAVNNLVKKLQNIMRQDAGINGDAQRIEQMVWLIFLKVYDSLEEDFELDDEAYESIIPEPLRWRNWAPYKDIDGKEIKDALTDKELLDFIDQKLFPVLKGDDSSDGSIKGIKVTKDTPRGKSIVRDVFMEVNQYMKNGVLLRQMINVVDDIDLFDAEESHAFGDMYEGILKDLQGAGNAGEFYTPRAVTDFVVQMLNPRLGEKFGDFAGGTAGFLVSAINHVSAQKRTIEDERIFQNSFVGQEWKPFPYLLAVTNLLLHKIKNPEYYHMNSLSVPMVNYKNDGKVNVIGMNPPYGGATDSATKQNFKQEYRSSETADLFMVLIMERLAENGRAGVIIPDGFLFGTDGPKRAIKERLLREFNLHTIIRLPQYVFAPYTSIATNILFFDNNKASDATEGFSTGKTWIYRMDMPEGYKHFSRTNPMKLEHCQPIVDWWHNRTEIVDDVTGDKARSLTAQQLLELDCNFDQCKYPKEDEIVLSPSELLRQYHERRNELDAEIDERLNDVEAFINNVADTTKQYPSRDPWQALADMTASLPEALKKSILLEAIQGKLVPQDSIEESASVLLDNIRKEKEQLVKDKKLKKKDLEITPIKKEEKKFDIPPSWEWCRLKDICIFLSRGRSPIYADHIKKYPVFAQKCNLKSGGISLDNARFIDPKTIDKWAEVYKLQDGDVLVNSTGTGTVGRTRLFDSSCLGEYPFVVPDSHVSVVRTSKHISSLYIYYYLCSFVTQKYFEDNLAGSTNQKELYIGTLGDTLISLPPFKEQQRIVERLNQILPKLN